MDRLAKQGIVFDRGYTCNPVCTPARISMLTGHYPSKHGCYTIGTSLPEDYPTIPKLFSQQGYFTGLIGKGHYQACLTEGNLESEPHIFDRDLFRNWDGPFYGFEYAQLVIGHADEKHAAGMHYGLWLEDQGIDTKKYFGTHEYTDFGTWQLPDQYSNSKWTADETIQAIERSQEQNKPFMIWSSFQDPHNPCFVSEPWASMYAKEDMPIYELQEDEMKNKPPFYQTVVEGMNYGDDPELNVMGHCISDLAFMNDDKKKEIMTKYYRMISQMDYHIGRMIDYFEENDLMEQTIIVFTSDHGDYMGNHGMERTYGELYDLWKDPEQYTNLWEIPEHQDIKMELLGRSISAEMEKDGVLRNRTSNA